MRCRDDLQKIYGQTSSDVDIRASRRVPHSHHVTSPHRSTLGDAVKAMKADCAMKADAANKYCTSLRREVIDPLNSFLREQEKQHKVTRQNWKNAEREFEEKRNYVEEERSRFHRCVKDLDDGIGNFEGLKDKKDFNEDKRAKLSLRIMQMLRDSNDAEKSYRNAIYQAREARMTYIKALV